uniref:Uncharacterized protein n=1 Tax=Arundo donax TaxID=35708 RepID=A0A0A8Y4Y5_ARUDO
MLAGKKKGFQ